MVFCNGPLAMNQQRRPHDVGVVSAASDAHAKGGARDRPVFPSQRYRQRQHG